MTDTTVRAADVLRAVNARWPHQYEDDFEEEMIDLLDEDDAWVVVERSTITGEYNLSVFQSLADARYDLCMTQECPEDWQPRVAVSLNTGQVTELQRTYDWTPTHTGTDVAEYDDWRR